MSAQASITNATSGTTPPHTWKSDQMGVWRHTSVLILVGWLVWHPAVTRCFCGGHLKLGGWLGRVSIRRCLGKVDGSAAHHKSAGPREGRTEVRTSCGIMRGVLPKAGNRARKSPPVVQCGDNSSRSLAKVLSVPPYTSNFLQLIYNHMDHTQVAFEILSYLSDLLLHLFKSYCIYCCTALLASFHQSIFFIYSFYCFCSIIDSLNAALL